MMHSELLCFESFAMFHASGDDAAPMVEHDLHQNQNQNQNQNQVLLAK